MILSPHEWRFCTEFYSKSIPKINMEVASGLLTCLGLFLEGTPAPQLCKEEKHLRDSP